MIVIMLTFLLVETPFAIRSIAASTALIRSLCPAWAISTLRSRSSWSTGHGRVARSALVIRLSKA